MERLSTQWIPLPDLRILACNGHETIPLLGDNYSIMFETGDEFIFLEKSISLHLTSSETM
jgi:hypothetical protein